MPGPTRHRRPTAADVARHSSVSAATVSYVLNNTPGQSIPEGTKRRVLDSAAALGYVPSTFARALARGRSDVALLDFTDTPYGTVVSDWARHLSRALEDRGFLPIVDQLGDLSTEQPHARLLDFARLLVPTLVITVIPLPDAVQQRLRTLGVKTLLALLDPGTALDSGLQEPARQQVAYLVSRGHRGIAYCPAVDPRLETLDRLRHEAVRDACAQHGVDLIAMTGGPALEDVVRSLSEARRDRPTMTAVAAYNDDTAFAVLSAAHRLGLRVPDDLAVIGIDDSPLAPMAVPALTTVTISGRLNESVDRVVALVDAPPVAGVEPFDTHEMTSRVIERESA